MNPINEYVIFTLVDVKPFKTTYYYKEGELVAVEKYPNKPGFKDGVVRDLFGYVREEVFDDVAFKNALNEKNDEQMALYEQFRKDIIKHLGISNYNKFDELMDEFMEVAFAANDVKSLGFNVNDTINALQAGVAFAEKLAKALKSV
jgi:hypothetical protein